ncbi:MAG: AAA domain-containing protein [Kofleriaceae bacterium]|nr:AAA domain-containing protein [Kofleriaceae bacterium]
MKLDIETIRVASERTYAALVEQHPGFAELVATRVPDSKEVRRTLMARGLRLTESMAGEAYRAANEAKRILGIDGELELYQRSGAENAAIHLVEAPILLEIHGALLPRLDRSALLAVFGHELGHYLAHGHTSPLRNAHAIVSALGHIEDRGLAVALSRLSMTMELTADRVGLLACQDLAAILRLEMAALTGLASGELTWDTDAYLAQCRALVEEELHAGADVRGITHPEHNLRAYALWLFSETRQYRQLTGRGPGTRELADVDAVIARCFKDDAVGAAVTLDYSRLGEPPQELHECALACAVIVAFADGELADEEREAIERQFATLVPDWQTYLDLDVARARFAETAAVIAGGGADLARSLFFVLARVMAADGVIDPDEAGMILSIGRALGVEAEFRRGLQTVLHTLRTEIDLSSAAPTELPLPARHRDVDDAFQTFLANVVRRGESLITLRRLLRLLGSEQRSEHHVSTITNAFRERRISARPSPESAGLDDRMVLVASAARGARITPAPLTGSRAALVEALRRLREQLVSGDGRSPAVRLRQLRKGRAFDLALLERVSIGSAERVLEQLRARRTVRLVDAADAGRHGPAANASAELLALNREDAQRAEETGAHDLFAGYPFVTGNIEGYTVRAPLVLYPVALERDGDGARGFRLVPRRDELPIANQALIRLVFNKRGFAYSDELSDELEELAGAPEGGPEAVRAKLAEVGLVLSDAVGSLQPFCVRDAELATKPDGLELEEVCVIGIFPQSSSDLLQDYDALLQDLAQPDADVSALLGAASTLMPDGVVSCTAEPPSVPIEDWTPVIPADPSQRSVIAACRTHGATVIDGPPGTGKSQVIVNLVAEALRRGERVAVVCEKRAALDVVYQRLTAIGFGKALAVVHDVHEDRKALYAHVAARIETRERIPFDAQEVERVRVEHAATRTALEQRTAALRAPIAGLDLRVGDLLAYVAGQSAPELATSAGLEQVPQQKLREVLDLIAGLHPLAELWSAGSPWRADNRASLASTSPQALQQVEGTISKALEAARVYEDRLARAGVPIEDVEAARGALDLAIQTRARRSDDHDRALFGSVAKLAATEPARLALTAEASRAYQQAQTALVRFARPVELDASNELVAAMSVLRRWASSWGRIFVLGWWKARGAFRRELTRLLPERAGDAISPSLLDELADRIAATRAWRAIGDVFDKLGLQRLLPATTALLEPAIERVATLGTALGALGEVRPQLERIGAWLPAAAETAEDFARWDQLLDERRAVLAARDALAAAVAPLATLAPGPLAAHPRADVLAQLLERWRRDHLRLAESDALIARLTATLPSSLALLDALHAQHADAPASMWRTSVAAAWSRAWLARLEREQHGLATLGSAADDHEVERLATRLRELETERRELEIERTLAHVDDAALLNVEPAAKGARRTPEQKVREELLKETRKQRSLMPLRTFVRRFAPHGLLDAVPVWLLSPETMAILFPRQPLFDLVVFDEASQCTVEAGLPVLMRAQRVAIAGDEKQMPPSSYFELGGDEDTDAPVAPDDSKEMARDLLGAESLLSLARPRVAHTGLSWHYRCRDESLIAFSNHAMYAGGLLTIPSTAGASAPSALHWVHVANATYASGENPAEATRVVDVVDELLARTPRPTIGVVTFNLKQRRAVLDAIDTRAASDPAFRERWLDATTQGALDERPFVKNLEQVQGDERDVIVFSLGHAPVPRKRDGATTTETYVPARFGPLGQRGGERRLNVAISRAKAACYVVSSFDPAQLAVSSSKHQGPRLFKHFLEFAHHHHHGRKLEAARVLDLVRAQGPAASSTRTRLPIDGFVPIQTQLALELETAGIPYEPDVGASDFRVPIAILDPHDPTRYALGILIDDGHGSADPFEHHVHRPGVLRQRDWNVLALSPASWHRRRGELLDEIIARVPGCRGAAHHEVFTRHREQQRRPQGTTGITTPTIARRAASLAVTPEATPPSTPTVADAEPPTWALAIADELFRKALLHLEKHGTLDEAALTSLVGGPRRARTFARELDGWRAGLPFGVEVSPSSGGMVYRRVAPA